MYLRGSGGKTDGLHAHTSRSRAKPATLRCTARCGTRARIYGVYPHSLSRFDIYSFREEPELRLRSSERLSRDCLPRTDRKPLARLQTGIFEMRAFTYISDRRERYVARLICVRLALPLSNKHSTMTRTNPVEGLLLSILLCFWHEAVFTRLHVTPRTRNETSVGRPAGSSGSRPVSLRNRESIGSRAKPVARGRKR